MIKPQFEAGKGKTNKGVVTDAKVHIEAVSSAIEAAQKYGFGVLDLDFSPIKGPKGNIEFLLYLKKDSPCKEISICDTVNAAHNELNVVKGE